MAWQDEILPGAVEGSLPDGYERLDGVVGRKDLLEAGESGVWSGSEFAARARTPHTTTSVEAAIRRRQLERVVGRFDIDLSGTALDLGCADGTIARDLLELGCERLVSTDILASAVTRLSSSLDQLERDRMLLVVDDLFELPFEPGRFGLVVAWGILSLTGDFRRALELSWGWLGRGGHLLFAEPLLEQALVYPLVRGDLEEFGRVQRERSRAASWDQKEERYVVNPRGFYEARLRELPGGTILDSNGVSMLPSLALGGVLQDLALPESEREQLAELLADPALDELSLWRQALWLVRKG